MADEATPSETPNSDAKFKMSGGTSPGLLGSGVVTATVTALASGTGTTRVKLPWGFTPVAVVCGTRTSAGVVGSKTGVTLTPVANQKGTYTVGGTLAVGDTIVVFGANCSSVDW